jgi:hypothetical protein
MLRTITGNISWGAVSDKCFLDSLLQKLTNCFQMHIGREPDVDVNTILLNVLDTYNNILLRCPGITEILLSDCRIITNLTVLIDIGSNDFVVGAVASLLKCILKSCTREQKKNVIDVASELDLWSSIAHADCLSKHYGATQTIHELFLTVFSVANDTQIFYLLGNDCFPLLLDICVDICDESGFQQAITCILRVLCGYWTTHWEYSQVQRALSKSRIRRVTFLLLSNNNTKQSALAIEDLLLNSWSIDLLQEDIN